MGAATLYDSRLEFFQHRRLAYSDKFVMNEGLNETYDNGRGIEVVDTYQVELLAAGEESEAHRINSQNLQPLQVFFSSAAAQSEQPRWEQPESEAGVELPWGVDTDLSFVSRTELFLRVANQRSVLDAEQTVTVDVEALCEQLWLQANGAPPSRIEITEMNLSGNQKYADMLASKIKWEVEEFEDEIETAEPVEDGEGFTELAFESERIRTFRVVYSA